jgi:hypothetical protein
MIVYILIGIFLALVVVILLCLSIFGIIFKPSNDPSNLPYIPGTPSKSCKTTLVTCNLDSDCATNCKETQMGEEMSCVALNKYTSDQVAAYGPSVKVCAPAAAIDNCDVSHGGIKVWSGWTDASRMEWDCLCSYPNYAASTECDGNTCNNTCGINPGICQGGVFDWDLTKKSQSPSSDLCTCPTGKTKILSQSGGIPYCVDSNMAQFYS